MRKVFSSELSEPYFYFGKPTGALAITQEDDGTQPLPPTAGAKAEESAGGPSAKNRESHIQLLY